MIQRVAMRSRRWSEPRPALSDTFMGGLKWMVRLAIAAALCLVLAQFMWGWLDRLQEWRSGSEETAPGWVEPSP